VRVGDRLDGRVEIVAGLGDGDLVVVGPPAALEDGRLVSTVPSSGGSR
jgi:hypothetical protein